MLHFSLLRVDGVRPVISPPAARPSLAPNYDNDVRLGLACGGLDNIDAAEPLPRPMGGNIAHDILRLGPAPVRFAAVAALAALRRH
ncbi:MAG: hypothetical protein ACREC9_08145 [Methylocella sp.]